MRSTGPVGMGCGRGVLRDSRLPVCTSVHTRVQVLHTGAIQLSERICVGACAPGCREGCKPGVHVSSGPCVQALAGVPGSPGCGVRQ